MLALKTVLAATDFGDSSQAAFEFGRELARYLHAELHVLHVVDDLATRLVALPGGYTADVGRLQADLEDQARDQLNALLSDEDRRQLRVQMVVKASVLPETAIVNYAREAKIDLIVTGTHGRRGIRHLLLGSVAETVVRRASCSVLTVRHRDDEGDATLRTPRG